VLAGECAEARSAALIKNLLLAEDARVFRGWEGDAGNDDTATLGVGEVDALADAALADGKEYGAAAPLSDLRSEAINHLQARCYMTMQGNAHDMSESMGRRSMCRMVMCSDAAAHATKLATTPRFLEDGLAQLQLLPQAVPLRRPCLPRAHDRLHGCIRWEEYEHAVRHGLRDGNDGGSKVSLVAVALSVLEAAIEADAGRTLGYDGAEYLGALGMSMECTSQQIMQLALCLAERTLA
jgi:hypothetical protein